jgi:pullulanase/glycogen debranching enzyme
VVSRAKLVAEPWDVGQMDSYDLGRFPRSVVVLKNPHSR